MIQMSGKNNLPRSTIYSWKNELRQKNKKVSLLKRGAHLQSGSGRKLSYPKEVEELVEWILVRRDCHLPVGRQMIKGRAASLIKGHNPSFKASNEWLDKFMLRNGLSMQMKTSVSEKLPAQLEKRIESFFIRVRALRAKH
uniref:HTH CENPB-type domain-containing protein n=1 Tax=Amphimedon queenslandica TaxID=400682 RepID=A0A1X7SR78_AMPQE